MGERKEKFCHLGPGRENKQNYLGREKKNYYIGREKVLSKGEREDYSLYKPQRERIALERDFTITLQRENCRPPRLV